jgi:phosphoglycolate phosphatase
MATIEYDAIIFDLDGTLWDASAVTATGWNNALVNMGLGQHQIDHVAIKNVSGKPFGECVEVLFGDIPNIDVNALEKQIDLEEEKAFLTQRGNIYAGVEKGLSVLFENYPLFLVSNCQSWYLQVFLNQFKLEKQFTDHDCNGNAKQQKPDMIQGLVKKYQLQNALYVGDTSGDRNACLAAGVAFGYVDYGFGDVEEADLTFSSFADLVDCLA